MRERGLRVFAGCDGGGTKCHVRVVVANDSDEIVSVGDAITGPSNVKSDAKSALHNICDATHDAVRAANAPHDQTIGCFAAALAGAGNTDIREEWQSILRDSLPVDRLAVVPDAAILFAAADRNFEMNEAVATVIGTGSIAWVRHRDGSTSRAGGLGPQVGDEGSAFWIGREAIRRVATQQVSSGDRMLGERIRKQFGSRKPTDLAAEVNSDRCDHRKVAALSADVFEIAEIDELCASIVSNAADQISQLILDATRDIETSSDNPLCWLCAGGVAVNQLPWLKRIQRKCREQGTYLHIPRLISDPVAGAVKMALAM